MSDLLKKHRAPVPNETPASRSRPASARPNPVTRKPPVCARAPKLRHRAATCPVRHHQPVTKNARLAIAAVAALLLLTACEEAAPPKPVATAAPAPTAPPGIDVWSTTCAWLIDDPANGPGVDGAAVNDRFYWGRQERGNVNRCYYESVRTASVAGNTNRQEFVAGGQATGLTILTINDDGSLLRTWVILHLADGSYCTARTAGYGRSDCAMNVTKAGSRFNVQDMPADPPVLPESSPERPETAPPAPLPPACRYRSPQCPDAPNDPSIPHPDRYQFAQDSYTIEVEQGIKYKEATEDCGYRYTWWLEGGKIPSYPKVPRIYRVRRTYTCKPWIELPAATGGVGSVRYRLRTLPMLRGASNDYEIGTRYLTGKVGRTSQLGKREGREYCAHTSGIDEHSDTVPAATDCTTIV